jgi:hypothetical protein
MTERTEPFVVVPSKSRPVTQYGNPLRLDPFREAQWHNHRRRDELRTVLDFLRSGDVLMVTRIDRLARSIGDLQDIVRTGDRHENRVQSQKDDRFWLADPWRMADGSVY